MPKPHIEVIARGVCVMDGHVLVCRNNGCNLCYLPGGHVEFGEPARAALEREIREELGCSSRAGAFLGGVEHGFVQDGKPRSEINLVFALTRADISVAHPVVAVESHLQFPWVPVADLASWCLEPSVLVELLPDWLAGQAPAWQSSGSLATARV